MQTIMSIQVLRKKLEVLTKFVKEDSDPQLIERALIDTKNRYKEAKGSNTLVKKELEELKNEIKEYKIAVEDNLLSNKQKKDRRLSMLASISLLKKYAQEDKDEVADKIHNLQADNVVVKEQILEESKTVLQIGDELNNVGNLSTFKANVSSLIGPVGISYKNVQNTPETSKLLQKLNENNVPDDEKYLDAITLKKRTDYDPGQGHVFDVLKGVQNSLKKLPSTIPSSDPVMVTSGPLWAVTSPIINKFSIDRLNIKADQLFPGWVFKNQVLLAYDPTFVGENKNDTIQKHISRLIKSIADKNGQEYMDVTDGAGIGIKGNKLRFLWLLSVHEYIGLNKFTIDKIGFPSSGNLVDPSTKSRKEHERDAGALLKAHQAKEEEKTSIARANRLIVEKAIEPLSKKLDELIKQQKRITEQLNNKFADVLDEKEALNKLKKEKSEASALSQAYFDSKIEKLSKKILPKIKQWNAEKTESMKAILLKKKSIQLQIEAIKKAARK